MHRMPTAEPAARGRPAGAVAIPRRRVVCHPADALPGPRVHRRRTARRPGRPAGVHRPARRRPRRPARRRVRPIRCCLPARSGKVSSQLLGTGPAVLDESISEAAVRAALAGNWPPPQVNEPVILHGDYWPGNTLWRDGRLGVIDWEDAACGDPLADLGNARLEILMHCGDAAKDGFTSSTGPCGRSLTWQPCRTGTCMQLFGPPGRWTAGGCRRQRWRVSAQRTGSLSQLPRPGSRSPRKRRSR